MESATDVTAPQTNGNGTVPRTAQAGPYEKVQLGEGHDYTVYPQRIGRLESRLRGVFGELLQAQLEGSNIIGILQHHGYMILQAFIPQLMPEYEFRGFATAEALAAYSAGDESAYDERYDKSPDFPQIVNAFQAGMRANRLELFGGLGKALGKVISPEMLKAAGDKLLADSLTQTSGIEPPNDAAPSTDGLSDTSGTTDPTSDTGASSDESEKSDDSSNSPPPTSD